MNRVLSSLYHVEFYYDTEWQRRNWVFDTFDAAIGFMSQNVTPSVKYRIVRELKEVLYEYPLEN